MTNEEREKHIRIASMLIGAIHDLIRPMLMYQIEKDVAEEALDNYIKMLEQQPCEGCISREDAKNLFWDGTEGYDCRGFTRMEIGEMLDDLPSVTPSRPRGKWIHWTDDYKDYVTCSCCEYGEEGEVLLSDKTPFCPICGTDMRENEESE